MSRPFNSELVIDERISESRLKAYHVGFDEGKFRLQPLVDVICEVIPEFALGSHEPDVRNTSLVSRLREAANLVFQTDKYKKRGEFGELILHLLLRDFHNTIPLVSKIYFKDSHNVAVHGFDAIQVTIDGDDKKLWLGESKLYKTGPAGIAALIDDFEKHLTGNYLRQEFSLIAKKVPNSVPERDHWLTLMHRHQKLDTIFKSIVIPMVCTYGSEVFNDCTDEDASYCENFERECLELFETFTTGIGETELEVILLLLPVPDKEELNSSLYTRLDSMRRI